MKNLFINETTFQCSRKLTAKRQEQRVISLIRKKLTLHNQISCGVPLMILSFR